MGLEDVITTGVESAGPSATAEHLAKTMADSNVGSVVVTEDGVPVGMVTDRDLAERVLAMGRDPAEVTAADLMSGDVQVLAAGADVLDATAIMHRETVRRLPVVDEESRLVGIVTLDDLLRLLATELDHLVGVVERESGFY
ncbi:MAG: CBS domain-containing protein [Halobacteriales archaeon]